MGLDTAAAQFLCAARSIGVDFSETLTIGRQSLWGDPVAWQRIFNVLGIELDAREFLRRNKHAEPFLALLGAQKTASMDASNYEQASLIHDLNRPVPEDLKEQYSVVHDGGTLEHVFHVPQALRNCMEMVRVGGHFTQVTVANNFLGHGFWQFSPELLFRVFSAVNGFQIKVVLLHEVVPGGGWYVVRDPDVVQSRVELRNELPTYLLTIAQRVSRKNILATPPQQSDYVALWNDHAVAEPASSDRRRGSSRAGAHRGRSLARTISKLRNSLTKRLFRRDVAANPPLGFRRPYYRRIAEEALLRGEFLART